MMSPEVAEVLTRVSEELEVQITMLEREGVTFAQLCCEYALSGRPTSRYPTKPVGMQPQVAALIRELTLDELVVRRRA